MRTRLRYNSIQQIVGSDGLSVIVLTDEQETRSLNVVCDQLMASQLLLRHNRVGECQKLLPEVLLAFLQEREEAYELFVYNIANGQYQTVLTNSDTQKMVPIRLSDAVLLTAITDIPLYIDEALMARQSCAYSKEAQGIAIPINTIALPQLNAALEKAIADEDYRLASQLRDEIKKRKE